MGCEGVVNDVIPYNLESIKECKHLIIIIIIITCLLAQLTRACRKLHPDLVSRKSASHPGMS